MWLPTEDEAVDMYARFLVAHHGPTAIQYARKTGDKLLAKGDFSGHAIWNRVADVIERRPKTVNVERVMALS
jgi:hypothetical protein